MPHRASPSNWRGSWLMAGRRFSPRRDARSGWAKGGQSGPALVPGKPDRSLLISAVRYEDLEMPPKGKLPGKLVRQLALWVADGAHDPRVTKSTVRKKEIAIEAGRQRWAFCFFNSICRYR